MAQLVTDQNFSSEVLKSTGPVLVDFFAPWCGPCQMLGPVIDKLAEDYKDKAAKIVKVNIDDSPKTAEQFQIMSVPTLLVFQQGQVQQTLNGVQAAEDLKKLLDKLIS